MSLGGTFAVAIVSMLVVAKRKKAATNKHLHNGPIKRSDSDVKSRAMAPLFLVAGKESVHPDGTCPDSDSVAAVLSSDGGGGGGSDEPS